MYFQLKRDKFSDIEINEPENLPLDLSFMRGTSVALPKEPEMVFTTNAVSGDKLPDFAGGSIPVMSLRFLTLLENAGVDNLQKFPILIKSEEDDTIWNGYFAVNILGLIQCADLSKSDYGEICDGLYDFDSLAIDTSKLNGVLLFRLQESFGDYHA